MVVVPSSRGIFDLSGRQMIQKGLLERRASYRIMGKKG